MWKTFRFTNKTARVSFIWGVLVPVGVFAILQRQDVRLPLVPPSPSSSSLTVHLHHRQHPTFPPSHPTPNRPLSSRTRPIPTHADACAQQLKWDVIGAQRDTPLARFGKFAVPPSERAAAAAEAAAATEE